LNKVEIGFEKIECIAHIADVHIRNLRRHKEYKQVFRKLYKDLKENLPANSIIYLAGDIAHAKTEMSPELIEMTSDLFTKLSKIAPTILIAGNHDCNLNNKSRLDALSPIVDSLQLENFYYLKDNGLYDIADCVFNVMSVFNDPEEYILSKNINTDKTKIALYHGSVESATTDVGFKLPGEVTTDIFNGYDMVLLGDIHKQQYLNKQKTIAYAGSLVCQNWGEHPTHHGYIKWDAPKRKPEYRIIENDYAYVTLEIENGKIKNKIPMPKYPRLRIKVCKTEESQLKTILAEIRKTSKLKDVAIIRTDRLSDLRSGDRNAKDAGIGDVRDPNYQNRLIVDYLERNFVLDDDIIKTVKKINKDLNSNISQIDGFRNLTWKPMNFEFSNMFSYGTGNSVNFSNMKGAYGLFAPNAAGKSALLDAITYCLFDKCSRSSQARDVMNSEKNTFHCKLHFKIDGQDYFIERNGSKGLKGWKEGKYSVKVNFWTLDEQGNEVSLNGEARYDTNKIISSYVGNFEDFILTALSVQNNNTGFIDMSQFERKDLLAQFLDIKVFDDLYRSALDEIKDVQALLKDFKKNDFTQQLADAETELEIKRERKQEVKKNTLSLTGKIKTLDKRINALQSKIIELESVNQDIDSMDLQYKNYSKQIEVINDRLHSDESIAILNKEKILKATTILEGYDIQEVEDLYSTLCEQKEEVKELTAERDRIKVDVKYKLEKLESTNNQYDSNCEFCKERESESIKIANETKASLEQDKKKADIVIQKIKDCNNFMLQNADIEIDYNKIIKINSLLASIEKERNVGRIAYYQAKEKRDKIQQMQYTIELEMKKYHENKKAITHNNKTNEQINELNIKYNELTDDKEIVDEEFMTLHGAIEVALSTKNNITQSIKKAEELEQKFKAYEYYIDAIQRDGVPYELITKVIPIIEEEVNDILAQIVEFKIMFQLDGKNINTFIVYSEEKTWPLELTSGMEKFISSLAIRTALVNVSNLPRPNFLAIDEGLGNLDSENLNSLFMLFTFLKSQFDLLMIISHLDSVRDVVDNLIDIKKVAGFSKITHE
jgi:DNA repair exonuclease SbcCD ATPase subunit